MCFCTLNVIYHLLSIVAPLDLHKTRVSPLEFILMETTETGILKNVINYTGCQKRSLGLKCTIV